MIEDLVTYLNINSFKRGDRVKVIENLNGHNYIINKSYTVLNVNHGGYLLIDDNGNQGSSYAQSYEMENLSTNISKEGLIKELENIVEFLKDFDFKSKKDFAKSYKVYNILKEVKSSSSDAEKLEIISKYIK